ncbi:MAG: hypothetical protein ABIY37_10510, partial [Devosia sp.]
AVTVLTGNGVLLHHFAFPMLRDGVRSPARLATIAALGGISSVSWTCAAFVGSARMIAGAMSLEAFLGLYGLGLTSGIRVAVLVVAPMLRSRLSAGMPRTLKRVVDEATWSEDIERHAVPGLVDGPVPLRKSA